MTRGGGIQATLRRRLSRATREVAAARTEATAKGAVYLHAAARRDSQRRKVERLELQLRRARAELGRWDAEARATWPPAGQARRRHNAAITERRDAICAAAAAGMTRGEIAEVVHLHPAHVSRIARGERR